MPPGKPFVQITDEQRKAFGEQAKKDGAKFLRDVLRAGAQAGIQHVDQNPNSVISQTVRRIEEDVGGVTMIARGLRELFREDAEASASSSGSSQSSNSQAPKGKVVDAEFIEEEPRKR